MQLKDNIVVFNINRTKVEVEIGKTSYGEAYNLLAKGIIAFTIPNAKGEAKIVITNEFYGIDYADVTLTFVNNILKSITINPLWKYIKEDDDCFDIGAIKIKCETLLSNSFDKVSDKYSVVTFESGEVVITSMLTCNSDCYNYYLVASRPNKE